MSSVLFELGPNHALSSRGLGSKSETRFGSFELSPGAKNRLIIKYIEPEVFAFLFATMFITSTDTKSFTATEKLEALKFVNDVNDFMS